MAKSSSVKVTGLGDAISQELTLYSQEVTARVDRISEESVKRLVTLTKPTAPSGERGEYKRNIASKCLVKKRTGNTYVWYVKGPNSRLTHLLVKGHETRNGGRTRADPFLANACDEVLPAYEAAVERTIQDGK
jgi:hypothetical protein